MKRKILYSCVPLKEFSVNSSCALCDKRKRKKCEKVKRCLNRLCGNDEETYFGKIDIYSRDRDKAITRRDRREYKIRSQWFKKCKPIEFIIRRPIII